MTRTLLAATLLLAVTGLAGAAPTFDANNPVDMYGPDGMAFTPDDPLIAQGGYTDTAMFLTIYGHRKGGTDDAAPPAEIYSVLLGSWNPQTGSIWVFPITKDMDPQAIPNTGGAWRKEPFPNTDKTNFHYYPYTVSNTEVPAAGEDYWNGGKNVRVSYLRLQDWNGDGNIDAADPALKICPEHLRGHPEMLRRIEVSKTRLDVGVLDLLGLDKSRSGIAAHAFAQVWDPRITLKGEAFSFFILSAEVDGTVSNASCKVPYEVKVAGLTVSSGDYEITEDIAAKIVNKVRDGLNGAPGNHLPALPNLSGDERNDLHLAYASGKPMDGIANQLLRDVLRCGKWLPWLATNDPVLADTSKFDISGVPALNAPRVTVESQIGGANISATNNGMSYVAQETLIYGRDKAHKFCRLVEWFGATWLCVNLTIFNPYGDDTKSAYWDYRDVIIGDKNLTPDSVIPCEWPPGKGWNGGQGFLVFGEEAVGHKGDAQGGDVGPQTSPGNPRGVVAMVSAIQPGVIDPGKPSEKATYNFRGFCLAGSAITDASAPTEAKWADDPEAAGYVIPWPPTNTKKVNGEACDVKFLYANVANGHDKGLSNGRFVVNWDFGADGSVETAWGNTSWPLPQACQTFLFIRDKDTGRTGFHQIDIAP